MSGGASVTRRTIILEVDGRRLTASVDAATRSLLRMSGTLGSIKNQLGFFSGAFLGFKAFQIFEDVANTFVGMNNALSTLNLTATETMRIQNGLFDAAQASRQPIEDVTKLYVRLDAAVAKLGFTQDQVLTITKAVSQGLALGQSSAQEAAAAITQLSQAFASGRFQGDEFRSVLENAPGLAQRLATELHKMGVIAEDSIKSLRAASTAGILTPDVLGTAFLTIAPQIQEQFAKMNITVAQFLTLLRNEGVRAFADLNREFNLLKTSSAILTFLVDHIKLLSEALIYLAEVAIARFAIIQLEALVLSLTSLATGGIPVLLTGIEGLISAFGGLPVIILTAVAALALFFYHMSNAATELDKFKEEISTKSVADIQAQIDVLQRQRDQLEAQRKQIAPRTTFDPFDPQGTGGANYATGQLKQLDDQLSSVNQKLSASKDALDAAEAAMKKLGDTTGDAAASSDQFIAKMSELANQAVIAQNQLDALHRGNLQQYQDLKDQAEAEKEYLSTKASLETAQKRPLTGTEEADLQARLQNTVKLQNEVTKAHSDLLKAISAQKAADAKALRDAETAAKAALRLEELRQQFHQRGADLAAIRDLTVEKMGDLGLEPAVLREVEARRKSIVEYAVLEKTNAKEHLGISQEELANDKLLIDSNNQLLVIAENRSEQLQKLRDLANQQAPEIGQRRQLTELQTGLADPEVLKRLSPEELAAVKNGLADIEAGLTGIGLAAQHLAAMNNPFAVLLAGIRDFNEASKTSSTDTVKTIELVGQGVGSTLQFIGEQASTLGIQNFEFQKALGIANATINAALAITEVLANVPYPYSLPLAAVVAGLAGAQIGIIARQTPPQRAMGGVVSAGSAYQVGELGPELYKDVSGRQVLIPSAQGTITPGGGKPVVNVINQGPPLDVVDQTENTDGSISIIVRAVKASQDSFAASMRSGQGPYYRAIADNLTTRRR